MPTTAVSDFGSVQFGPLPAAFAVGGIVVAAIASGGPLLLLLLAFGAVVGAVIGLVAQQLRANVIAKRRGDRREDLNTEQPRRVG